MKNSQLAEHQIATNQKRIAFFDSGQGGLTVWESVVLKHPKLNTIYLGDNARYPYGNKSAETVTRYASEAIMFLTAQSAEMIVVACGTASSVAVQKLQKIFRVPVIGIVEGFCAEAARLNPRNIAVLGTRFTVASQRFVHVLAEHGVERVWQRACPLFVSLVEEGITAGNIADAACRLYLADFPDDVDVVMLACTHFPRFAACIAKTLGEMKNRAVVFQSIQGEQILYQPAAGSTEPPIRLLDTSTSIANSVGDFIRTQPNKEIFSGGLCDLYCTDAPARFAAVASLFTTTSLPEPQLASLGTL
jgi:glutamate racemase